MADAFEPIRAGWSGWAFGGARMKTVDWERVVREDGPAAWRTACRLLGNRQDAEDCLQDALADLVEISRKEMVRSFRALLQRVVTARAMDQLRRRYRRKSVNPPGGLD